MATRAPKGAARPKGGTAGRGRPASTAGRPRANSKAAGGSRGSAGAAGRGRTGAASQRRGTPYSRDGRRVASSSRGAANARRPSTNPFMILLGWIASAIAAVWMELANGVGSVARLFGDSARDLAPAPRRDGAGLAVLAGAIVAAGAAWWHLGSPVGRGLTALIRGVFGVGA